MTDRYVGGFVRDDDGALVVIGKDGQLIGGGGAGRLQGDFQPDTDYRANDIVVHDGVTYYANENFTSGASFVEDDWTQLPVGLPALTGLIPSTEKGAADGVAELDSSGKVPSAQLPSGVADRPVVLPLSRPGELVVGLGQSRIYLPTDGIIESIEAMVGVAPDGQPVIVDVNKNGTTLFTTQGERPEIEPDSFVSGLTVPDITTFAAGDYLTVDRDQVGFQPVPQVTFVEFLSTGNATSQSECQVSRSPAALTGHIQIVSLRISSATATVTPPAGWTQIGSVTTGTSSRVYYFWRIHDSDPGPWTFTFSASTTSLGRSATARGVDQSSPIDDAATDLQSSASTWTYPDLTTTEDNGLDIIFGWFNTFVTIGTPAGYTSRLGFGSGSAIGSGIATKELDTAGLEAGPVLSLSAASAGHRARIMLKAAEPPEDWSPGENLTVLVRYLEQ